MHKPNLLNLLFFLLAGILVGCQNPDSSDQRIRVLILSGRNNHDWEQTTPVLSKIFTEDKRFLVDLTNSPDTFNFDYLRPYDVIVSNWNSWPENDLRWPRAIEEGLIKYVNGGGGLVFFHASTSVFYQWPEFQDISTAAWVEKTHHSEKRPVRISIDNQTHPITKGLSDFFIFDELWIDAKQKESFQVLGSATKKEPTGEECEKQPAILVSNYGEGRIFHTILGHDARTLRNSGFRTLITRATEWAASGAVNATIPQEMLLSDSNDETTYAWITNDTTYGLAKNNEIVWQFNFNTKYGKPFFHPIYLNRNRITCLSPDDHLWHLGQWFSWKYINGINYWEYIGESFRSEGITDITKIDFRKHSDFSADISLEIDYHPHNEGIVLKEKRTIHVSPPVDDRISMDYSLILESAGESVVLDRTPILGEPEGKSWGGYAGLSLRFNQDFMGSSWTTMQGDNVDVNGTTGDWLYMGFMGLHGTRIGSAIFISDIARREGEAWYLIDQPQQPFYYFSPAHLYLKPVMLHQEEVLQLNYRILHITGDVTKEMLESEYQQYISKKSNQ
jgi:type 1 glutamine amidotransferase